MHIDAKMQKNLKAQKGTKIKKTYLSATFKSKKQNKVKVQKTKKIQT